MYDNALDSLKDQIGDVKRELQDLKEMTKSEDWKKLPERVRRMHRIVVAWAIICCILFFISLIISITNSAKK